MLLKGGLHIVTWPCGLRQNLLCQGAPRRQHLGLLHVGLWIAPGGLWVLLLSRVVCIERALAIVGELKAARCTKLNHWSDAGPHFRRSMTDSVNQLVRSNACNIN